MEGTDRGSEMTIVVDDAKRETHLLESYVSYRILTTMQKANAQKEVFEVRRRFNDFEWLHSKLLETLPGCVVPPLPDKNALTQIDRFDREFIALRQAAFQVLLRRIAAHPQMRLAHDVRVFLTTKAWDFEAYKKGHPSVNTLFAKMSAQVKQLGERAASVQVNRTGISFAERPTTGPADRFARFRELATVSKERLHAFVTQLAAAASDEHTLANDLAELAGLFTQCGNNEDSTRPALQACATALTASSKNLEECVELLRTSPLAILHEYENYSESAKYAIRNLDAMDAEQKRIVAQIERGNLSAQKHEQLEDEVRRTRHKMETSTEELLTDLQRWCAERNVDLRSAFIALADTHIRECEAEIAEWEAAIQPIQHISDPTRSGNAEQDSDT